MGNFKYETKKFTFKDIDSKDTGVKVSSALALIKDSLYYDDIYSALKVEEILNEIIEIPGANKLINSISLENNRYYKVDIDKRFQDLSFRKGEEKGSIEITFQPTDNYPVSFTAIPIYSAQTDFFDNSCSMGKYANRLLKNELSDVVLENLEHLRSLYNEGKEKHVYKYRILRDENNNHFFRATTSTDVYKDYNISLSVFVGLVALHKHMKTTGQKFIVNRCEYNESFIRVFFEKVGTKKTRIGEVKYLIELNNNEIKEGAVRFSGVSSIIVKDESEKLKDLTSANESSEIDEQELYIKPRPSNLRYALLGIKHNVSPKKAIPSMILSSQIEKNEKKLYEDLDSIGEGKTLPMIRLSIVDKIKRIQKESELGEYKSSMLSAIPEAISNYYELLRVLRRLDLIAADSLEAKEQLRYLFYESLLERRSQMNDKDGEMR